MEAERSNRVPYALGWAGIVVLGGLLSAMSAPGQTAGLSVFTDPIIADWGITRTGVSTAYLIGTLGGAAALPLLGRAMDRWSLRVLTAGIGVAFALFLLGLSVAESALGLTVGFTGIRMMGQGALSLAATTMVAKAVSRQRGLALGLAAAIGSGGISLAPLLLSGPVAELGIRSTWRLESLVVLCVVVPLALMIPRPRHTRSPSVSNQPTQSLIDPDRDWTLSQAARTGMFWVLILGVVTSGMLSTALAFHQISVLGAQGLSPLEAAANFLPQTVSGILATVGAGSLVDRVPPRYGVTFSMAATASALLLIPLIAPGWSAVVYGLVLGAAAGSLRGIEAAAFARYFGTRHIGSIRGFVTALGLAATAVGPVLLSLGHEMTGNYLTPALILAILPVMVGIASLIVPPPNESNSPVTSL